MDNTLRNKAHFFSVYWGQNVIVYKHALNDSFKHEVNKSLDFHLDKNTLWLKSIKNISEEDLTYLNWNIISGEEIEESHILGTEWEYLRSKGYALSWMGLSVEKQVAYNWVKLVD